MDQGAIKLSNISKAFISSLNAIEKENEPLEGERFEVSQTASLVGFAYEKIRNSVEFNEEHLIRRLAIARILKRRLELNTSGQREGENLARELMWGRYISSDYITKADVKDIQKIISNYMYLLYSIKEQKKIKVSKFVYNSIIDFMSSEIDELLAKSNTETRNLYLYYFYQVLRRKVKIPNVEEETKDRLFYVAAERAFSKNDFAFIKYHLFALKHGPILGKSNKEIQEIAQTIGTDLAEIHQAIKNPYADMLYKFARKQVAPFRILYSIFDENKDNIENIVTNETLLREKISETCKQKYTETGEKLRAAAIRSIIYIFITKMVFVLILEFPLTKYLYGHVEYVPLAINTLFPPLLMGTFVSVIRQPSHKNTSRITERIIDILNRDQGFEESATTFELKKRKETATLFAFSIIYLILFSIVFGSIYLFLDSIGFNIISKGIFIFFMSVVAFFGYRIRQTSKEYVLQTKTNILISIAGFFFLPVLSLGKILSNQISKINLFIILFDYIIEAPFKLFIDVFEDWSRYVKARKEELL